MNRPSSTYSQTHPTSTSWDVFARFDSSGTDPRKGWRTPLNKNRYSEQRDAETRLSYFGARYYDANLTTGWLSVDPMADKYPSISPYNYCAGNPVKLVDPDGQEIWIIGEDGSRYQYKNRGLYNENGTKYNGNDKYATGVAKNLKSISPAVRREMKKMEKSTLTITITNNGEYSNKNGNGVCMLDEDAASNGKGSGSIIYYDKKIKSSPKDGEREPFVGLAHELGHAYDGIRGCIDDTKVDSDEFQQIIPFSEISAVRFENKVRGYWNMSLRMSYDGINISKALK